MMTTPEPNHDHELDPGQEPNLKPGEVEPQDPDAPTPVKSMPGWMTCTSVSVSAVAVGTLASFLLVTSTRQCVTMGARVSTAYSAPANGQPPPGMMDVTSAEDLDAMSAEMEEATLPAETRDALRAETHASIAAELQGGLPAADDVERR